MNALIDQTPGSSFQPRSPGSYTYLILGSGRQGTAAAYDLARFGDAARILMADKNAQAAQNAARRINQLAGHAIASAANVDVSNPAALKEIFDQVDAALSAVPYIYNLEITRTAIAAGIHLCDLGGHTNIVRQQHDLDTEARAAGISVVPDCGMGPGLNNTMGAFVIDYLDEPQEVHLYDGGLPQEPKPPWNYQLTFHINGLTNEMDGRAVFLREGQIVEVDTLTEPEYIDFPPIGKLEADVTSGGTSTAPWSFQGKVEVYQNKTLRYPGHFEWLRAYKTLGLFSEDPILVGGMPISPRQVYHTLLEPKITAPSIRDVCVIRAVGKGAKDGIRTEVSVDLIDYYDTETGFTAMERLTGWHASIMMIFQARGQVKPGVVPVELAVSPNDFMLEIGRRGIQYTIREIRMSS